MSPRSSCSSVSEDLFLREIGNSLTDGDAGLWRELNNTSLCTVFHLPVMDPSLDQENDDDRSGAHDVQYKGGHGVGVVGPVDGLVAAEESILVWLTDECKN